MSTYIWDFVIIGAVVLIFLVFARRIPVANQFKDEIKEEKKPIAPAPVKNPEPYSLMGEADKALSNRKYNDAEKLYIQIATQEPTNPKVYFQLGTIYLAQKNYYDAKDAFLQTLKLEPENLEADINLSTAYMELKDYFKATQVLLKALDQEPKNKKYHQLYEKAQKALEREKKRKK